MPNPSENDGGTSPRPSIKLPDEPKFVIEDAEDDHGKGLIPPGPVHHDREAGSKEMEEIDEGTGFTFRAVAVGTLLGCIIGASNMYLGLTVGWSFGGSLFGSIVGFAILKPLSRILPLTFGGGYFGPKENCTVQSAASAAGGLSVGFVSAIPALYRLQLMSPKVTDDTLALIMWSLAAAYFGLFFAIPLRRYFILKQKLVFPSPTVSAETIRSLHDSTAGELSGRSKAKILLLAFFIALIVKCVTWWVPVMLEWHVLYYLGSATNSPALIAADLVWKWRVELAGAFLGAGMLIGVGTAGSFFGGSLLAWAIIGPSLLSYGVVAGAYGFPANMNPSKPMSESQFHHQVTAQYWLLWPGVTMMISSSFSELGVRWPSLWRGIKGGIIDAYMSLRRPTRSPKPHSTPDRTHMFPDVGGSPHREVKQGSLTAKVLDAARGGRGPEEEEERSLLAEEADDAVPEGRPSRIGKRPSSIRLKNLSGERKLGALVEEEKKGVEKSVVMDDEEEEDPAPPHFQVPMVWWGPVGAGEAVVAILLGFVLAFVGIQASGETDINPTGSIGKTSQFIFAAFRHEDAARMLKTNLIAGNVAAACASQTVDMVGDLKTAHLLRASPRSQFLAQAIGSFAAVFLSVGLFTVFGTAYPCFLSPPHLKHTSHLTNATHTAFPTQCPFEAPAVASWTAVSVALTSGISKTIPVSAAWTSLGVLLFTIFFTILKHKVISQHARQYLPNLNAIGIALVNPQPHIGFALMVGAVVSYIWKRRAPGNWEMFCFAVASGLIAGEGIGGIVEAIYALAGLQRSKVAVAWGIPGEGERELAKGWALNGVE
ncbi:hypothetical protein HDU67_000443 [Dinochytrium kinnereticum]|nr:hypothetical protein HDU67_000443 [Dinochytrium kinnereticum]